MVPLLHTRQSCLQLCCTRLCWWQVLPLQRLFSMSLEQHRVQVLVNQKVTNCLQGLTVWLELRVLLQTNPQA
jgi:hypothetical protein